MNKKRNRDHVCCTVAYGAQCLLEETRMDYDDDEDDDEAIMHELTTTRICNTKLLGKIQ